jgi:hypothetical protein
MWFAEETLAPTLLFSSLSLLCVRSRETPAFSEPRHREKIQVRFSSASESEEGDGTTAGPLVSARAQ